MANKSAASAKAKNERQHGHTPDRNILDAKWAQHIYYYDTYYGYSSTGWFENTYVHKALIKNVVIDGNIASRYGGGISTNSDLVYQTTLGLENVKVINNAALGVSGNGTSDAKGGGIYGGFSWAKNLVVCAER